MSTKNGKLEKQTVRDRYAKVKEEFDTLRAESKRILEGCKRAEARLHEVEATLVEMVGRGAELEEILNIRNRQFKTIAERVAARQGLPSDKAGAGQAS